MYGAAMISNTNAALPNRIIEEPSISVIPDQGEYLVQLRTTNEGLAQAMEVMRVLLGVSDRMYKAVRNVQSQEQGQRRVQLIRFQQDALAKLYCEYRSRGYKHRAAIAIVAESEIAVRLRASKADVGVFVKAYQYKQQQGGDHESSHELPMDGRGAARITGDQTIQ